ncbi:hypothetical protein CLF_106014 [Clonorchis sinensis]|uniref:Uncharacterized protein n=1 Tax=Clonorchis sinensis TaxID=79923 RepID=G7YEJ8_CLOSI|nr:hypothetical protein CLF_106014 [Clonorchis sinensis]
MSTHQQQLQVSHLYLQVMLPQHQSRSSYSNILLVALLVPGLRGTKTCSAMIFPSSITDGKSYYCGENGVRRDAQIGTRMIKEWNRMQKCYCRASPQKVNVRESAERYGQGPSVTCSFKQLCTRNQPQHPKAISQQTLVEENRKLHPQAASIAVSGGSPVIAGLGVATLPGAVVVATKKIYGTSSTLVRSPIYLGSDIKLHREWT